MKIEAFYPNRQLLGKIEEPYRGALEVLNTLYMEAPQGGKRLDSRCVIDCYVMNCVRAISEKLTRESYSFPSVFNKCKELTFINASNDKMDFNDFRVNADYEQTAIFGAVYYVLTKQGKIAKRYLDFIEKTFASETRLKGYFQPFKDALNESSQNSITNENLSNAIGSNSSLQKENEELSKRNQQLEALVREYTGDEGLDGTKKPYFTTNQIAIAAYFLFGEGNIRVLDNQQAWAKFMSKMSRRNSQNIREALSKINSNMDDLKGDAIIVANTLDAVAPAIAEKIRKNFDV